MNRPDLLDELPEEIAEYVPDTLPDKLNPGSEAEEEGMYLGVALVEWAIHERGFKPADANKLIQRVLQDSITAAQLDQLGLPDNFFLN